MSQDDHKFKHSLESAPRVKNRLNYNLDSTLFLITLLYPRYITGQLVLLSFRFVSFLFPARSRVAGKIAKSLQKTLHMPPSPLVR